MSTFSLLLFLIFIFSFLNGIYGGNGKIKFDQYPIMNDCGHPFEVHNVVTMDGYILTLHRVPLHTTNTSFINKRAVIFVPGFACSASVWMNYGLQKSLPCILANNNNYDVWLVNYRGSLWSKNHYILDPNKQRAQFWNFTMQEVAYYDIPAVIDYVLANTQQKSVYYISHSIGISYFLAMAAERKEYENKVQLVVALAPAVYVQNAVNPLMSIIAKSKSFIKKIAAEHGVYAVFTQSSAIMTILQVMCSEDSPLQPICIFGVFLSLGYTPHQVNKTLLPFIVTNFPSGVSLDFLFHSMQSVGRTFDKYDYGKKENLLRYKQEKAPGYNIAEISTPIALYYSDKDYVVNYKNVEFLATQLRNVVVKHMVKGYNHMDFIYGNEAVPILFKHVINIMNKFNIEYTDTRKT